MIVSPFYDNDVFSSFADQVVHVVIVAAYVLHGYFVAWTFGSIHTNVQDIVTYKQGKHR